MMPLQHSQIKITRLQLFDGIDHKQAVLMNRDFPLHFHHEWSLAWIETGSELLHIQNHEILMPAGTLVLIPPHVAHANKGQKDAWWQYRSIYLNKDAFAFVCLKNGIDAGKLQPLTFHVNRHPMLWRRFASLTQTNLHRQSSEDKLADLFSVLLKSIEPEKIKPDTRTKPFNQCAEMVDFLNEKFREKITLEYLSEKFGLDKFILMRRFKGHTGLSPQEYLLSLRIEHAKKLLSHPLSLVEVSYESGFYDQSHFSHTFQKYAGMSPGKYRSSCNILQDNQIASK